MVKSGLRVGKKGKVYNKTRNCIVCKKKNIRRQTTFICGKCGVPLCSPELTERSKAPRDCFREYHEDKYCDNDFSSTALKGFGSDCSDDDFEKKPKAKRPRTEHEWTDNCVPYVEI